jgi:ribosomal-protein-alanine N-acetyltransferase
VPTLDAVAEAAMPVAAGAACLVACIDGQRGDVFFSMRDVRGAAHADEGLALIEPLIATPEEASAIVAGRLEGRSVAMAGDGVRRYAAVFAARLAEATLVDESMTLAEAAARMAARHPDRAVVPHAMRPIYLRRPDAVVARERAAIPPRPGMSVRRASGAADLAAVDVLQRQSFTNPWGAEAIRWELEHTDVARLYVLEAPGGAIVAYCACWLVFDELHINSLAVEPARRRQGLARLLLKRVLGAMAEVGARSATLEVRTSNTAARALYEGLGFKVEGIRRNYYQEPKEDGLVLWNRDITATTR